MHHLDGGNSEIAHLCNGAPALRLFYAYGRTVVYVVNDVYHFGFWSDIGVFFLSLFGLSVFLFFDLYFGYVAERSCYGYSASAESCAYDGCDGSCDEGVVRTLFLWLLSLIVRIVVIVHNH